VSPETTEALRFVAAALTLGAVLFGGILRHDAAEARRKRDRARVERLLR